MATNDAEPLTTAELDALDALRPPGLLRASGVTVSVDAGACAMGRIVAMCSTTAEARAIAAALNALPALLAEVRAARSSLHFNEHVQAHDAEGRYVQGWIVALDAEGRVQLDIVTGAGMPSGRHSEWLANPERCPVYKPSTFRYFSTLADDGTGDVIDHYGRRPGP